VLVYACSGTALRHSHGNILDHHTIFVTSARLAQKFNDNRTRDDNLRVGAATSLFPYLYCSAYHKANWGRPVSDAVLRAFSPVD
jgi:hypothetical protein